MSRRNSGSNDTALILVGIAIMFGVAVLTVNAIANGIGSNVTAFFTSIGAPPETAHSVGGTVKWVAAAVMLLSPVWGYLKWR